MSTSRTNSSISRSARRRTDLVENSNNGGFLTAHILGQPYGEMNPKFVEERYLELDGTLTVFDRNNRTMTVGYNGSTEHPLILTGWNQMRNFFGINGNKLILMNYVGNSRFLLEILPQEFHPYKLPSYHSYRTWHTDITSFNVELTPYLATGSQLTLNKDFARYIRLSTYSTLVLYGPGGDEVGCDVLIRKKTTKIGQGWKQFVKNNGFEVGDILNFKFVNKAECNLMKVIVL